MKRYIDNCASECDLAVIFYSNLSFHNHVDEAMRIEKQTLALMKRNLTF